MGHWETAILGGIVVVAVIVLVRSARRRPVPSQPGSGPTAAPPQHDRHGDASQDRAERGRAPGRAVPDETHRGDFDVLGLRPGASLSAVQGAYRELCLKYHPDVLAAQNLPPHILELSVAKFREITAAYERLKQHADGGREVR